MDPAFVPSRMHLLTASSARSLRVKPCFTYTECEGCGTIAFACSATEGKGFCGRRCLLLFACRPARRPRTARRAGSARPTVVMSSRIFYLTCSPPCSTNPGFFAEGAEAKAARRTRANSFSCGRKDTRVETRARCGRPLSFSIFGTPWRDLRWAPGRVGGGEMSRIRASLIAAGLIAGLMASGSGAGPGSRQNARRGGDSKGDTPGTRRRARYS